MSHILKRYDIMDPSGGEYCYTPDQIMKECKGGEWVEYDEAQSEIDRLRKQLLKQLQRIDE